MKHGEATVSAEKTAISWARAGAIAGILLVFGLLPLRLSAAIGRDEAGSPGRRIVVDSKFPPVVAVNNDDTLPAADDHIPPLAEAVPNEPQVPTKITGASPASPSGAPPPPDAAKDDAAKDLDAAFPRKELGLMDRVQDWLARANREFQFTIIRRLSTAPPGGGGDEIARKLEDVKEEDAKAAADRAEEAIRAAQAKQAAEAKHRQELTEAAEKAKVQQQPVAPKPADGAALAEQKRKERERLDEQRKLADEKRKADDEKRVEEARLAQAKLAEQRAAEDKKAAEKIAAKAAVDNAAKEKELAAQRATDERHQRELADAAEKAAENARRVAAKEEAAKAAAEAKRQAEAEEAAQKAAEKEVAAKQAAEKERAAQEAAAKQKAEQGAKEAAAKRAAEKQAAMKQAMVEPEDEDKTNVAEAPPAAGPAHEEPPAARSEAKSSEALSEEASQAKARRRLNRVASYQLAHGPVVKPWVRRARQGRCRFAGRKILVPGRYTVARGDTLSLISLKHYQTSRYYLRIYAANRDILSSPNRIYPCERLYLPRR